MSKRSKKGHEQNESFQVVVKMEMDQNSIESVNHRRTKPDPVQADCEVDKDFEFQEESSY
jgi:hypothetical protein